MAAERNEVPPPWVEYPGFGPADMFWRQSGEPFFTVVWKPFYESLSEGEKKTYLAHWEVPDDWQKFYFDKDWRAWLESTDEDE